MCHPSDAISRAGPADGLQEHRGPAVLRVCMLGAVISPNGGGWAGGVWGSDGRYVLSGSVQSHEIAL